MKSGGWLKSMNDKDSLRLKYLWDTYNADPGGASRISVLEINDLCCLQGEKIVHLEKKVEAVIRLRECPGRVCWGWASSKYGHGWFLDGKYVGHEFMDAVEAEIIKNGGG